jgi:hypothetical protein
MDLLQRVSLVSDGENYEAKRLSRPHRLGDLVRSSEYEPLRADRPCRCGRDVTSALSCERI